MFIENIEQELDVAHEWFVDENTKTLLYIPPNGTILTAETKVEVSLIPRVIQFRGSSIEPSHDIELIGFNISHAAPTYMESYEDPSGGDWSIHRGAAVFLHGAKNIAMRHLKFDQVGGNGVFLSNYAINNSVLDCDFWRTGDS